MAEKQEKETPKQKGLREETQTQFLTLITSAFGLVAALAWNQVIQEVVADYIKPIFGKNSGVISLFIYAIIVTIIAVIITYLVTRFLKKE